jgi:hypothetical protein
MRPVLRFWVARCCYPDRKPFLFGTMQAESEMQALTKFKEAWAKVSPHPAPTNVALEPGMLVFVAQGGDA